jgi:hypothetical protein
MFLTHLSRIVQRATMYPPGHPAVGAGLGPFVEHSRQLLAEGRVTIAVGRTRLLVASGVNPPSEHESRWIASRLFEKEIATLVIEPDFDAEEAAHFVAWLARPGDHAEEPFPELTSVKISRFDGSRFRFREEDAPARPSTPEVSASWRLLTSALADQYGLSSNAMLLEDPAALADRIRQVIHASEGTGIAVLADHLVDLHSELVRVGGESRTLLLHRLAALVECLSPELRGSLLSVGTGDRDAKVALVEAIVDDLPMPVVRDIVANLRIEQTPVPPMFGRFLRKLVRLSLTDPALGEGLDLRFREAGLPASLFAGDDFPATAGGTRGVPPLDVTPETLPPDYRDQLELLAASQPTPVFVGDATAETTPEAIDRHVAQIALLEARMEPLTAEAAVSLRTLRDFAPRELERGGLDLLAEIADVALRLAGSGADLEAELHNLVEELLEFYRRPATVDVAMRAIVERPIGSAGSPGVMLAAGGGAAAQAGLDWLKAVADVEGRTRVMAVLLSLEAEVVRATVLPGLSASDLLVEAFATMIEHVEPARAIEIGLYLSAHPQPAARLKAITWLLGSTLTSGKRQRVLQRALADDEPRIVALGMEAALSGDRATATDAFLALVARQTAADLLPFQIKAVRALGVDREVVIARLAQVLAVRPLLLSHRARQLSVAIAAALARSSHATARAAVRSWRLSPAGLLSLIAGPRAEAP